MRTLTSKQKKLLDAFFVKTGKYTVDDIPKQLWDELVAINDTEVLHSNIDRYLGDLQTAKIFGK